MNLDEDIIIQKNVDGEDTYLFDPYNPLNKLITNEEIEDILKKYGLNDNSYYNLYKRFSFIVLIQNALILKINKIISYGR